jgi:mercuric reductase
MEYALVVIGSGSAAFAAGIEARSQGATVALVEAGVLGGTCVNVGCVPSKTLLVGAEIAQRARKHPFDGIQTSAGPSDLGALVAQKDKLVAGLRRAKYADVAAKHGIEILQGIASFTDGSTVRVGDRIVRARDAVVVATGAAPAIPDLPGLEQVDYLTSTTAMALDALPSSLVVIGAGFVGVEQAQLFAHLGSRVALIGPLMRAAEPELTSLLDRALVDQGVQRCGTKAMRIERTPSGIRVDCEDGTTAEGSQLLIATGRSPRTADLGLDLAQVALDRNGAIVVDSAQRSSNPKVFAAGDVAGNPQFVYVAAAQGRIAARNALNGSNEELDYTGLPHVAFTTPQLAWAGLTEPEATAAGFQADTRILPLDLVPRAIVNRVTEGAIKLVAETATGRLLGVHVLAEQGGELMLSATIALKAGWTVEQLATTWAPYLTMNEGLKLAAQSFTSSVATLSCCAA